MDKRNLPDKPFKTFEQMIDYLQEFHELRILDPSWASNMLKVVQYYDLINGYKEVFMHNDKFDSSICFEYLYLFHAFDQNLQNILFEFSVVVENYFKNNLAYVLAKDFGVYESEYLSPIHYLTSKGNIYYQRDVRNKITSILENPDINKIPEPTRHYKLNHNHVPPWILMKNISFSNSINLYRLLKSPQKENLANLFVTCDIPVQEKIQLVYYSLTLIRKYRNVIAHNLKFISFDCKRYSSSIHINSYKKFVPRELVKWKDLHKEIGIFDILGYIAISLAFIPESIEKDLLIQNLISYLKRYANSKQPINKEIFLNYCSYTNIPQDICVRLEEYLKNVLSNTPLPNPGNDSSMSSK